MGFADTGLVLAWALLALWLLAVALTVSVPALRSRFSVPTVLPVLIGAGCMAALVVAQAAVVDGVADSAGPSALDRSVLDGFLAVRTTGVTTLMKAVSVLGGTAGMAVLALIAAVLLWRARRRAAGVVVIIAAAGAAILVEGFKHLYERGRPPAVDRLTREDTYSLPSGHALGSLVVLGVLAAVIVRSGRRAAQVSAVTIAAAGIALIAASRLYLGVHWITDVLAGWMLGGAWLAVCVTALVLLDTHNPSGPIPAINETVRR